MAIIRDENGKWVSANTSFANNLLKFGKTALQDIASETLSVGVEVSKNLDKLDERITGGFFDFPTELKFEEKDSIAGKIQRNIFGEDRDSIGGFEEEGEWASKLYQEAYNLDEQTSKNLGTGTMALFALTNFIPGKKTLVKSLVKNSNKDGIIRELIKNNVPESIAIQYSPFLASAKTSKEVKGILSQIDETLKLTKEIVPEKNISRSVVGDDIVEVTTKNGVIEMPTLKKSGDISIQTSKQSAKDVQHLISLKNKANTIRIKTLLREKEQILKQGFKSTLQKEQETFANKMINVVKKFKEAEEKLKQGSKTLLLETKQAGKLKANNLQEVKNSLFKIAKENIPDQKISKQLTKKLVEAGDSPAKIRNVILSISREKDNIIKKQLKESIKDIVKSSNSFTLIQKEKVAATIDKIRMTGISKDVEEKIISMRDYFQKNPERELVLGRKNSKLLARAEDLSRKDLNDLSIQELRELERRLSYIKESNVLERKTRTETKRLQNEIIVDTLSKDAIDLDIKGKIDSIGKELTTSEKVNNFWYSFKERAKRIEFAYVSADNFFDNLGKNFKEQFKYRIDDVSNFAKDKYARSANSLLGKEAELFKKYGEKLSKTNYERIMIYATKLQKGGREKLNASGLTDKFIDDIKLTPQELEWYKFARKELDNIFPKVDDVLIDTSNGERKLGKTENYFPMSIDFDKSEELAESLFKDSYYKSRGTNKGFTKHRNIFGKEAINLDARDIYLNYMRKANNFIEMEKTVKQLQEVASNKKLKDAIGKDASSFIDEWLDTISRDGISKNYKRHWVEDIRNNIGSAFLGFKISTILKQPLAKITSGALLGAKHTFAHDVEFASNKLWEIIDDISLQQKYRTFDDPSYEISKLNKFQRWGYEGIKATDKITANSVWYSAYKKFFDDNNIKFSLDDFKSKKINDEAVRYADEVVRKTQGSSDVKDISKMFRADDRALWKTLFQFQSFILNQSQLLTVDMKNAIMKEKNPTKAMNILMFFVLTGLGESYISSGLTNVFGSQKAKEADEKIDPVMRVADSFFGQIPLINNAISVAKFGGSGIPLIDTAGDMISGANSLFTSSTDKAKAKGAISSTTAVASLFGIPGSKQLEQFIKAGIETMDSGETYNTMMLVEPTKTKTIRKRATY